MSKNDFGRVSNRGCNNGRFFFNSLEPENPIQNDIWFDQDYNVLKYYNGSAWIVMFGTGLKYIKKTSDEGLASSTSLQNDDDLVINDFESNSIYEVKCFLASFGNTGGDIKTDWVVGGSASQLTLRHCLGPATSNAGSNDTNMAATMRNFNSAQAYGIEPSSYCTIQERFLVQTGTASTGSVQLRWAQNSSNTARTTVTDDSYITYRRIG